MKLIQKLSIFLLIILIFSSVSIYATTLNLIDKKNDIKELKIGVTLYKQDDTFISLITKSIEDIAREKERQCKCKIIINVLDAKDSLTIQNSQVNKFIAQNYDVICVNLVDRTAAAKIIDKAKSADIPLIFFNREPVEEDMQRWNKVYYVGARAEQAGEMQANIILKSYKEKIKNVDKNGDGKIQYVMLEGEQNHQDALIRTEYCTKTMNKNGIELEKLADDTANWQYSQGRTKMMEWINAFGDKIEVVFSNNDEMALGAINALENRIKNKPLIVGTDGINEALKAIKNGFMTGTVISDHKKQANEIVDLAYILARKEDLNSIKELEKGKYIRTNHTEVTSDNVNMYLENK